MIALLLLLLKIGIAIFMAFKLVMVALVGLFVGALARVLPGRRRRRRTDLATQQRGRSTRRRPSSDFDGSADPPESAYVQPMSTGK